MRQHVGVFTANFSSNLLWQNCFAPKKSAFCAEPRRVAAGILDVCQGGATTGLRETRLLRRMFSYARRPKRPVFVCGEGCRSREGQKPLPHGKKRIPAPVCTPRALASRRALARNDSAARWERRDTWVPPYGVRRSSRADRVVRPYKAKQEPCKTGRRGRRPLRNHKGCVQWATRQNRNRAKRDVEDAVPYTLCHCEERSDAAIRSPQPKKTDSRTSDIGHWRGMTALRAGNGGTHGSRPTGYGGHPGRTEASAPTRQNRNRAKQDVEDAVPYTLCHCEERSDAAIRSPQPEETDSHASDTVTGSE